MDCASKRMEKFHNKERSFYINYANIIKLNRSGAVYWQMEFSLLT